MSSEGEIVLIYYQDQPGVFARIESIEPDVKKDWYQVTLLLLTLPTQTVTWILKEPYIYGSPFTMGGRQLRLEEVKKTKFTKKQKEAGQTKADKERDKPSKVIPFKRH